MDVTIVTPHDVTIKVKEDDDGVGSCAVIEQGDVVTEAEWIVGDMESEVDETMEHIRAVTKELSIAEMLTHLDALSKRGTSLADHDCDDCEIAGACPIEKFTRGLRERTEL